MSIAASSCLGGMFLLHAIKHIDSNIIFELIDDFNSHYFLFKYTYDSLSAISRYHRETSIEACC